MTAADLPLLARAAEQSAALAAAGFDDIVHGTQIEGLYVIAGSRR